MPWDEKDASRFTRKANTPARREAWAATANAVLRSGQSEAIAVRTANAHIKQLSSEKGKA